MSEHDAAKKCKAPRTRPQAAHCAQCWWQQRWRRRRMQARQSHGTRVQATAIDWRSASGSKALNNNVHWRRRGTARAPVHGGSQSKQARDAQPGHAGACLQGGAA